MSAMLLPVLLAGGSGTRLWPVSRKTLPKQLAALVGDESLLQQTARRFIRLDPDAPMLTVGSASQAFLVKKHLDAVAGHLAAHRLLEPVGRNTAPAVAAAALYARDLAGPETQLWVCPSDHLIGNLDALLDAVARARGQVADGYIVTFGITPSRPETGFGYIKQAAPIGEGVFAVERFVEKPPLDDAEAMLRDGGYVWNSGMFLFRADTMLAELERYAPDLLAATERAYALLSDLPDGARLFDEALFAAIPDAPIDKAVMEKSARVAVVPVDPDWSDLGNWQAIWEELKKDDRGNACVGDALAVGGAEDCLVMSGQRLVAVSGVRDLAVIETEDAVLVTDRRDGNAVRAVVDALKGDRRPEADHPAHEQRPWGSFRVLHEAPGYKVKEIVVMPGGRLSLQSHAHRSEHWTVVRGHARFTIDDRVVDAGPNESVYIPLGAVHRMENPHDQAMHLIEVQCGSYLGEDDIKRYEDIYGRV